MTYSEKLKDPRWQRKRLEILQMANFRCEDCGRSDRTLDVHHCAYISTLDPWDYDAALLMCVCTECHFKRQKMEDAFRVHIGKLARFCSPSELEDSVWDVVNSVSVKLTEKYAKEFQ